MKRLFNNPWFVGSLVIVAAIMAIINIWKPKFSSSKPVGFSAVSLSAAFPDGTEQTAGFGSSRADFNKLDWIDLPRRDPFSPAPLVYAKEAAILEKEVAQLSAADRFRLVAVVVEPGARFATINKTIVTQGDLLEEYRVVKIGPDFVMLKGIRGVERLGFGDASIMDAGIKESSYSDTGGYGVGRSGNKASNKKRLEKAVSLK